MSLRYFYVSLFVFLAILNFNLNWIQAREMGSHEDRNREHHQMGNREFDHNREGHDWQRSGHENWHGNGRHLEGHENVYVAPGGGGYPVAYPNNPPGTPGSSTYDYYSTNPVER